MFCKTHQNISQNRRCNIKISVRSFTDCSFFLKHYRIRRVKAKFIRKILSMNASAVKHSVDLPDLFKPEIPFCGVFRTFATRKPYRLPKFNPKISPSFRSERSLSTAQKRQYTIFTARSSAVSLSKSAETISNANSSAHPAPRAVIILFSFKTFSERKITSFIPSSIPG